MKTQETGNSIEVKVVLTRVQRISYSIPISPEALNKLKHKDNQSTAKHLIQEAINSNINPKVVFEELQRDCNDGYPTIIHNDKELVSITMELDELQESD
jgi:hypothetical protein